jgi:hypothetical protein
VKAIFDLWYEGIPAESITSFRFLEGEDLNSDSDRTYLCKAKKVLSYVVGSNGNTDATLGAMSPSDRSKYFQEVCIPKLLELPAALIINFLCKIISNTCIETYKNHLTYLTQDIL